MCLISPTSTPRIAEEDITVYKILVLEKGNYSGPYYVAYSFKNGENVAEGDEEIIKGNIDYEIFGGFLHAYTHEKRARLEMYKDGANNFVVGNLGLYKMTVPKGTKYFLSVDGGEICAKKLVWNQQEKPLVPMDDKAPFLVKHYPQFRQDGYYKASFSRIIGNPNKEKEWKGNPDIFEY